MSKCLGCGILLQNHDRNALGYTPNLKNAYCERCFKTIHYNEEKEVTSISNEEIIQKINKLNKTTIFITDLFSLKNELFNLYKQIKNKKVLVINKCDIIPDNLKLEHLEENIKKVYGLKEDVFFISAKNKSYLNRIVSLIESDKEVILCGETSSGKSTLINNLLGVNLTTSHYQNTTLAFIKLQRDDYVIYDTPGLFLEKRKVLKKVKCSTKKLTFNYILTIGDIKIKLARLNTSCYLTIYLDNEINIVSKKEDSNLENSFVIKKNSDIILPNGFIYVKEDLEIKCNQKLEIRNSIIK